VNVLDRFTAAGVRFRLEGDKVVARMSAPITDELRAAMLSAKDEIKAELEAIESRRQRLLTMLAENPDRRYALIYDTDASTEYDVLVMAIPAATFEVRVPKPKDSLAFAMKLMQSMDRHYRPTDLQSEGQKA
jgi:hypothetical protein